MDYATVETVLAGIASAQDLKRIGGGSETDVYATRTGHLVYKVKRLHATTAAAAGEEIETLRRVALSFAEYLGPEHSISTEFVLRDDGIGGFYAVAIQPYLRTAKPLATININGLDEAERCELDWQLVSLLRQALRCYHATGHMPDLYGAFSRNVRERRRMNTPLRWPWRIWLFLTQRPWSAHNLLLTEGPQAQVVLVDYDPARWRGLWGRLYYAICWLLFFRDYISLAGREANYQLVRHTSVDDAQATASAGTGQVTQRGEHNELQPGAALSETVRYARR